MTKNIGDWLSQYPDDEPVPLIDLARYLGVSYPRQSALVKDGLVKTLPGKRGKRGGERLVGQDEAVRILLAGTLATAMGLSLYVLLKALASADIDPAALASVVNSVGKAGSAGARTSARIGGFVT